MVSLLLIVVLSYLAGSMPGSIWVGKGIYGIDVREHGSGNAGATNTFRVLGWQAGTLATLVDMGKGLLAAGVIASIRVDAIPFDVGGWDVDTFIRLLAGFVAIVGHMYPVFAGFKGGKGVNTAGGVLFALTPFSMVITLLAFAIVLFSTRYVSLASLTAAVTFPSTVAIRKYVFGVESIDGSLVIISLIIAVILFITHRSNIQRLMSGTENRVKSFKLGKGMRGRGELEVEES